MKIDEILEPIEPVVKKMVTVVKWMKRDNLLPVEDNSGNKKLLNKQHNTVKKNVLNKVTKKKERVAMSNKKKDVVVYDKMDWHNNLPKEEVQKRFSSLMNWLNKNNYLSDEGKEIYRSGIKGNIAIHSGMLTDKGKKAIKKYYDSMSKMASSLLNSIK